ncbi:MAG: DJ-1/PfpI family protein [Thiobacillaceae bacterium]
MKPSRRKFVIAAALTAAGHPLVRASDLPSGSDAKSAPGASAGKPHDMPHPMPESWMGSEQIALLIYPEFTALDMVGPYHMFTNLMGAKVHLVAKTREPVKSETGLVFVPSATFDECPKDLDIICVPGGSQGTLAAMDDQKTMHFLKDRGSRAKYVTSVCTGSLLLGAAGLLEGYKATSHWAAKKLLPVFGATPADGRVVHDRNRITGGGVTAGIDFGLYLVGLLRGRQYAEGVQLLAEYAPEPPYDAGTPERAPAPVRKMVEDMFPDFLKQAEATGREAYGRTKLL